MARVSARQGAEWLHEPWLVHGREPGCLRDMPNITLAVCLSGPSESAGLFSIGVDGDLWCLAEGTRQGLVRWSLHRRLRVYASLGELVTALRLGRCVGLLPWLAPKVAVELARRVQADELCEVS